MAEYLLQFPGHESVRLGADRPVITIGRTSEHGVVLKDPAISRQHARIELNGTRVVLEDLDSRHGCRVNGKRVDFPRAIAPGDKIFIGPVPMVLRKVRGSARDAAATPPVSRPLDELRSWGEDRGRLREVVSILQYFSLQALKPQAVDVLLRDLVSRLRLHLEADAGAVVLPERGEWGSLSGQGYTLETLRAVFERREAQVLDRPVMMLVPLEHEGEVLGLFRFTRTRGKRPFDDDDLRIAVAMGHLAAATLVRQRLTEELERRRHLEADLAQAEAATRAKSDFLAHISQEIRTPLDAMLGFADLALEQDLPPGARACLEKIRRSGTSLLGTLSDVGDFSRMEAGRLALESRPFRLEEVLGLVEDLYRARAEAKGLAFRLAMGEGVPRVLRGDALRLGQILVNLVANAITFTEAGEVRVAVAVQARIGDRVRLQFQVKDTGCGLSPAQQTRLFQPFGPGEPSAVRSDEGSGLGLVIARRLAGLMGGELALASQVGVGSTFSLALELPLGAELPVEPGLPGQALEGARILAVESLALNRELLERLLSRVGARPRVVATPEEAVVLGTEEAFDLVLLDVPLEGPDGYGAARQLRRLPGTAGLPLIALTAVTTDEGRRACREAGMDDLLAKPLEAPQLYRVLGHWMQASREGAIGSEPGALAGSEAVLDRQDALARVSGDEGLLRELLGLFLASHAGFMPKLRTLVDEGQRREALREVHSLKDAAGILGGKALTECAEGLEAALEAPEGATDDLMEALEGHFTRFCEAARRLA